MNNKILANLLLALFLTTSSKGQTTIYVDDDSQGGDGLTWQNAFTDLQDALDYARENSLVDEILVGQGLYHPDRGTGNRDLSFDLVDDVSIKGGYAGYGANDPYERDIELFPTILSADLNQDDTDDYRRTDDNSRHVIQAHNLVEEATVDGCTIRSGYSDDNNNPNMDGAGAFIRESIVRLVDCIFLRNVAEAYGGAINFVFGELVMERCTLTLNLANFGAGVYLNLSKLEMIDCDIVANSAADTGGGGFILADTGIISGCSIADNTAALSAGISFGNILYGTLIEECIFENNQASGHAGGITVGSGPYEIISCTFQDNKALTGRGGGVLFSSNTSFFDCYFLRNTADNEGGAIACAAADDVYLDNCFFFENEAHRGAAIYTEARCDLVVTNCIIERNFGNSAIHLQQSDDTFINCLIKDNQFTGMSTENSTPTIIDTDFVTNYNGGLMIHSGGAPFVMRCGFFGNIGDGIGGLINQGHTNIIDCVFSGNINGQEGGAIRHMQGRLILTNCTVFGNQSLDVGGGLYVIDQGATITNSILWNNSDRDGDLEQSQLRTSNTQIIDLNYSCVQSLSGVYGGAGNISDNPLFADPDGADNVLGTADDNLRLVLPSPCIDAGDNNAPRGDDDHTDYDGNSRYLDELSIIDTGNGEHCIIDMGAYEAQFSMTEAPLDSIEVTAGMILDGGISDLDNSDDQYLRIRSGFGRSVSDLHKMTMTASGTTDVVNPCVLNVSIETSLDEPSGMMRVRMYNWTTDDFDMVGNYSVGNTDELFSILNLDPTLYISSSGEIKVQIEQLVFVPIFAFTFESYFDLVEFNVN